MTAFGMSGLVFLCLSSIKIKYIGMPAQGKYYLFSNLIALVELAINFPHYNGLPILLFSWVMQINTYVRH